MQHRGCWPHGGALYERGAIGGRSGCSSFRCLFSLTHVAFLELNATAAMAVAGRGALHRGWPARGQGWEGPAMGRATYFIFSLLILTFHVVFILAKSMQPRLWRSRGGLCMREGHPRGRLGGYRGARGRSTAWFYFARFPSKSGRVRLVRGNAVSGVAVDGRGLV